MRNYYSVALLLGFILRCTSYGDVYVAHDRFIEGKIVTLGGSHSSEEMHEFGDLPYLISVEYSRVKKKGQPAPVEMKFIFSQAKERTTIRSNGAVILDSVPQEVEIVRINRIVDVSKKTTAAYPGEPLERISYRFFGTIVFQPDLWEKMLAAKTLAYRIYFNERPYTFILKSQMVEKLRLFGRQ